MNRLLRAILPALLALLPLTASGQQKDSFLRDLDGFFQMRADKAYAKTDTTYVGRFPGKWDVRLFNKTSALSIVTEGPASAHLSSGVNNRIGVGIDYRGFGLGISKNLGKNRGSDLVLDSYGKHLCFEFSFHVLTSANGTVVFSAPADTPAQGVVFISSKLNILYSINPRFSFGAAMKQSGIQKRSAGSIIAAVSWAAWDIAALNEDGLFTAKEFIQANYFQNRFSIGAGYGYNLVFGHRKWLAHASIVPMWTVHEMNSLRRYDERSLNNYPYGWISFTGTGRAAVTYHWGTRWSAGISGTINQMVSHNGRRNISNGNVYTRFDSQEWQTTFSIYYRF